MNWTILGAKSVRSVITDEENGKCKHVFKSTINNLEFRIYQKKKKVNRLIGLTWIIIVPYTTRPLVKERVPSSVCNSIDVLKNFNFSICERARYSLFYLFIIYSPKCGAGRVRKNMGVLRPTWKGIFFSTLGMEENKVTVFVNILTNIHRRGFSDCYTLFGH